MERPVSDNGLSTCGIGGTRVRICKTKAASEMDKWGERLCERGGENVYMGGGISKITPKSVFDKYHRTSSSTLSVSHHAFPTMSSPPFSVCRASSMVS